MNSSISIRAGTLADAQSISALAIQVFLDTYATEGVRPDLAVEAFSEYGQAAFVERLKQAKRTFFLAEQETGLIGFAEVIHPNNDSPIIGISGSELVRLYVQPQAQGIGVGRALLKRAEQCASQAQAAGLWLTAWEHNQRALTFYQRQGYNDVGYAQYVINDQSYGNRVYFRPRVAQ